MRTPPRRGEEGQMIVFLFALVVLILMVLALGWDTSNWFLGHRALTNLADGAAIAAANEIDVQRYYDSDGQDLGIDQGQAAATAATFVAGAQQDSGVKDVVVDGVTVADNSGACAPVPGIGQVGVSVEVRLVAPTQPGLLLFLNVFAPDMRGSATATACLAA